ncbi:MAG: hypothetical protein IKX86_06015 [Clostridia bacterium]|nr:hypothetical protein [Clostridia bacterium]
MKRLRTVMAKSVSFLLAAVMLCGLVSSCSGGGNGGAASEPAGSFDTSESLTTEAVKVYNTIKITPQEAIERNYIKITGRYDLLDDGAISCDWTGSGIEFIADCKGPVAVNVSCDQTRIGTGGATSFFTVWVDGKRDDRFTRYTTNDGVEIVNGVRVQGKNKDIFLAEDLEAGVHTFKIAKQGDPRCGLVQINYIKLKGTFLDRPADSGLYIEIIGDSLTAGYGNLGSSSYGDGSSRFEDGTLAYAYRAAEKLKADVNIVARPGIGLIAGSDKDFSVQMYNIYHLSCFWRSDTVEYEPKRIPDLVVYNLGSNDKSNGADPEEYGKKLTEFVNKLYGYYGEIPVLIIVNKAIQNSFLKPTQNAVKDFPLVKVLDYVRHTSGYSNHPTTEEGKTEANKLVDQIKQYFPDLVKKAV